MGSRRLAVSGWEKWPFLYLYLCWPHVARAPSGSVGEAGASVGLSCAHGPSSLYLPLVPVLTSRQRLVAWGEASRAGYQTACCKRRGRYDAGRSATGRPMRRLRPAQAVPLSPNGTRPAQTTTPFLPTLTSFLRPGPFWAPFGARAFATRRPPTAPLPGGCLHRCWSRNRMSAHLAWLREGGRPSQNAPGLVRLGCP
jgi:hypothetical protein